MRCHARFLAALALGLASSTAAQAQPYTFTTIAGSVGNGSYADGTNGEAHFTLPTGLSRDTSGNIFVGDLICNTVREISHIGTFWVVTTPLGVAWSPGADDGTNASARFDRPASLSFDSKGTMFVFDYTAANIRKVARISTNFVVTTVAGGGYSPGYADGTNGEARFSGGCRLAVGKSGNLYVADNWNHAIRQVVLLETNWIVTTIAGSAGVPGYADGTNKDALFNFPDAIAVDAAENLYVAEMGNCTIRKMVFDGSNWVVTTIAGDPGVPGSNDGTNASARFNFPDDIALDAKGALLVTDYYNNTVRKVTEIGSDWVVTTIGGVAGQSGSDDGSGTQARFNTPFGIAVDSTGAIFISDMLNYTIRMGRPAVPTLGISTLSGQVILAWPSWASNYVLETTSGAISGQQWCALTNLALLSGEQFFLTNSINISAAYYRLRKNE